MSPLNTSKYIGYQVVDWISYKFLHSLRKLFKFAVWSHLDYKLKIAYLWIDRWSQEYDWDATNCVDQHHLRMVPCECCRPWHPGAGLDYVTNICVLWITEERCLSSQNLSQFLRRYKNERSNLENMEQIYKKNHQEYISLSCTSEPAESDFSWKVWAKQ